MKLYKKVSVFCIILFSFVCCAEPDESFVDITSNNIQLLVKPREERFCYITFVRIDGQRYLIKQHKGLGRLLGVVRDAVAATVARIFFGLAHCVDVISAKIPFHGKVNPHWPATIHTVALGKAIRDQECPYSRMNIKQAHKGLRYGMFKWMRQHKDLSKIVALDTFLCNNDRHRGNLFYNKATNSLCAIDMDSAFRYNIAAFTYKYFERIAQLGSIGMTHKHKEIKTLALYKEALETLLERYTPDDIIALYDHFVDKAGFVSGASFFTKKIERQITTEKEMIRQSYTDVQKVVDIINQFLRKCNYIREKKKK